MFFFIYGYTYIYNTSFYNCFSKKNESTSEEREMLSSYTDTFTIGYRTLKSGSAFCGIGIEL